MLAIAITLALSLTLCSILAARLESGNRTLQASLEERLLSRRPSASGGSYERIFEIVLRDMNEGVLVIGTEGEFLLENPALTQVAAAPKRRDAKPSEWPELYGAFDPRTGEHLRKDQLIMPKSLRGESPEIDVLFRNENNPEGSRVHARSRPIRDAQGIIRGAVGFFRDVTASKRAEIERERLIAALERRNSGLEHFNYTVSTDLGEGLNLIYERLGDLERSAEAGDLERARDDIDGIGAAASEMKRLLDELLELSRLSIDRTTSRRA